MGFFDKLFGKKENVSPVKASSNDDEPRIKYCFTSPDDYTESGYKASNEEYADYIMSNNPLVKREEALAFQYILDEYDTTHNKEDALIDFDLFMNELTYSNPLHALQVCGFFCGLLGKNIGLSDSEIQMLPERYKMEIIQKLNS